MFMNAGQPSLCKHNLNLKLRLIIESQHPIHNRRVCLDLPKYLVTRHLWLKNGLQMAF